jgi:two-component system, OmpR family, response regulator VanR
MNYNYLNNLNVLYIEDDELVAKQTISLLEHFFQHVFYAKSSQEALSVFESEQVHILISDIQIPGINGLRICEIVRNSNPNIPIFITTSHDSKEYLHQAVKLNLVDFLIKPINFSTIKKTLLESLKRLEENGILTVKLANDLQYFPFRGELKLSEINIPMTQKEISALNLLLKHSNSIVSRDTLEYHISPDMHMSDAAYKNFIYRLRKKIGKDNLISLSGIGLKIVLPK